VSGGVVEERSVVAPPQRGMEINSILNCQKSFVSLPLVYFATSYRCSVLGCRFEVDDAQRFVYLSFLMDALLLLSNQD